MNTPLYDALVALSQKPIARFHMPGHKGKDIFEAFSSIFPIDVTETYDTGNLYTGEGPIRLAEREAARFYQAADCHFLTGGSTQGVYTMLYAAAGLNGQVLFDRNCHKSAVHAAALLDITPTFVYPSICEPFGIPNQIFSNDLQSALEKNPEICAVLITSPNYYGICQDIPQLAEICHTYGVKLLVDQAHGAHFPSIGFPSAVAQGADLAVVSAHKTLPALGQAACLLSNGILSSSRLREGASLFGTSSPSYPILASLDLARAQAETDFYTAVPQAITQCNITTPFLQLTLPHLDPCRLTISSVHTQWTGYALSDLLMERFSIACEMADARNIVCIVTPADLPENLPRLQAALQILAQESVWQPAPTGLPQLPKASRVCSVRKALFAPARSLSLNEIEPGQICARPVTPYPPGVPILWPGEEITAEHIVFLKNQCYNTVDHIMIFV